ncbi:MAG TPA: PsbP-related protein [Candidatus Nitrosopolaris sp.]|nr:PsbP-related protein [Candidatus Nitrosopolaris sp.]
MCCLLSITVILWTPKLAAAVTTPNSVHFIVYENSTYGIKMQYPSNWQKIQTGETNKADRVIVEFKLPASVGGKLVAKKNQTMLSILIHKLPPQNMMGNLLSFFDKEGSQKISLEAFVLSHLTNLLTILPDFHLFKAESGGATLGDTTPAHKLVYSYRGEGRDDVAKGMEILTVKDDKGYIIRYMTEERKYFDYLPSIQSTINSITITAK